PVVLGAGAQALVGLVARADVDGDHGQIVVGKQAVTHQVGVLPGAVLEEHGLAGQELVAAVVAGHAGQDGGLAGGVVDVQIENGLVVVQIGALDGVGGGDALVLILKVDGQ